MKQTQKWMSYVFMDQETKQLRTYTRPLSPDDDEDPSNKAPNSRNYLKMIEGKTATEAFDAAQEFIKEYLADQPIDFAQIRQRGNDLVRNSQGSFIQEEDGSVMGIVPNEVLEEMQRNGEYLD